MKWKHRAEGWVVVVAFMLILVTCTGCATIRKHPEATAVVVGFVAVSIALSMQESQEPRPLMPPDKLPCFPQRDGSCR